MAIIMFMMIKCSTFRKVWKHFVPDLLREWLLQCTNCSAAARAAMQNEGTAHFTASEYQDQNWWDFDEETRIITMAQLYVL